MAAQLRFVLEGGPDLLRAFRASLANTQALPLDEIAGDFRGLQSDQFRRGGPPSRKWRRNSPGWSRRKGGKPVGVFTGELRRSLTRAAARGAVDRRSARFLVIGTRVAHAAAFNATRPLLRVVTADVRREWADLMAVAIGEPILDGASIRVIRGRRRRRPRR